MTDGVPELGGRLLRRAEDLVALRKKLHDEGRCVVTINGCFDILHSGHVAILEEAARQGDVVIVGLNADRSVRMNKGPLRPIMPEGERGRVLLGLRSVDYVYIFPEKDCLEFVRLARPDVHVNDASYGVNCIESGVVREAGGRLHLVEKVEGVSTSEVVERVLARYGMENGQGQ